MLRNYIKIAWRNLVRNKGYSLINTIGLSIGIASCLLIFLFIQDELSYDRYHKHSDRLYRVYRHAEYQGKTYNSLATSNLLAPSLGQEVPGIEKGIRLSKRWPEVLVELGDKKFDEENFFFADPSIFELFSFKLKSGNPQKALHRSFTVIISESMARKYFDEKEPVGQSLTIQGNWGPDEYLVTGVMENLPHNSHFSINFLTSFETLRSKTPSTPEKFDNWGTIGSYTYVMLAEGVNPNNLTNDLNAFVKRHHTGRRAENLAYVLQPITDIHLFSHFERELEPNSDVRYLYIFGSIAFLILVVAGINYMNLATSRSADRAVEVGIRKTLGGDQKRLILQFLSESFTFCLLSITISLLIVEALLPYFSAVTGKPLSLDLFDWQFVLILAGTLILVGILAGLYPAFILSSFSPRKVLTGASGGRSKTTLRNALVVFQFSVTVILIIGTLVISKQLDHIREKRLGINQEQVMSISTTAGVEFRKNYNAFKDHLLGYAGIENITHINPRLPSSIEQHLSLAPEGFDERININVFSVGKDFLKTLEIPLDIGIDISSLSATIEDSTSGNKYMPVLINEAAVDKWGWKEPIGKTFEGFSPTFRVVGVVKDFHYRSLKEAIAPLVIWPSGYSVKHVLVGVYTNDIRETISVIETAWQKMGPGTPLNYTFLDDRFDSMYKAEDRLASLFGSFSLLAVFIAALGLLGLAAYTAQRRAKEIGIRKVFGATILNIMTLLSIDFLKMVLLGFAIAIPIAWYSMNRWLEDFAYRIEMGAGIFLMAGGVAVLIALATVSWQSVRAALMNPADSLRSE